MKKLAYYIAKLWMYGVAITPFRLLYVRSDFYFLLIYHVAHYRRGVVRQNLVKSFPDKDLHEIKRIEKAFYHNLCDIFLEVCKLLVIKPEDLAKRISFRNGELVRQLYDRKKNVFFAFGHYGNWEWFWKLMHQLSDHETVAIYKKLSNPYFDQLLHEIRTNFHIKGEEAVESRASLKRLLLRKDRLNSVLIVADQSPQGLPTDYWTEFLHRDTCWFVGVEKMARMLDYAVVFAEMKRVRRGYYEVTFKLISDDVKAEPSGAVMEKYVRSLESFIIDNPDNWLWSHRRWKHERNGF